MQSFSHGVLYRKAGERQREVKSLKCKVCRIDIFLLSSRRDPYQIHLKRFKEIFLISERKSDSSALFHFATEWQKYWIASLVAMTGKRQEKTAPFRRCSWCHFPFGSWRIEEENSGKPGRGLSESSGGGGCQVPHGIAHGSFLSSNSRLSESVPESFIEFWRFKKNYEWL